MIVTYTEMKYQKNWNPETGENDEDWYTGGEPTKCTLSCKPTPELYIFDLLGRDDGACFGILETETGSKMLSYDELSEMGYVGE